MSRFTDQTGRVVELKEIPRRIISLVPSQTELLYHLGLDEEVVGITKFCIHPEEWFRTKTRIGGTKQVNMEKIRSLEPDLILANKEENVREQIEGLAANFPVWISDVNTLEEAIDMINQIGRICNRTSIAEQMSDEIKNSFYKMDLPARKTRTAYFIWKDPYMAVGSHTFIDNMMHRAGLENIFSDLQRYPEIKPGQLKDRGCELLLLSSEPYPFSEKHIVELEKELPGIKMLLVNGEMFSWYGSRLLHAPAYFEQLHHRIGLIS